MTDEDKLDNPEVAVKVHDAESGNVLLRRVAFGNEPNILIEMGDGQFELTATTFLDEGNAQAFTDLAEVLEYVAKVLRDGAEDEDD